jgi:signal transduction histidine kinase
MLVEGRNRLTGLRGASPHHADVALLLRSSGEELAQAYGVGFSSEETGEAVPLAAHVREEVVRIGREALLNAFRHAGASLVRLSLAQSPERFELLVEDNGRGLPAAAMVSTGTAMPPGHWGLIGMRERAIVIGARLTIMSERGQGTRVRLVVPARCSGVGAYLKAVWRRRPGTVLHGRRLSDDCTRH